MILPIACTARWSFERTENPKKRYWLGKTEVTQGQWKALMESDASRLRSRVVRAWTNGLWKALMGSCDLSNFKGADRPVEMVSWNDAMQFCHKLTERERLADRLPDGYVYTLPTEAQWEYACRAGTTGDYAGDLDAMGWYDQNSGHTTYPVAQKQANAWGLFDMYGNVSEWCLDWYRNYPGGSVTDPRGPPSSWIHNYRTCRGGCWGIGIGSCSSAARRYTYSSFPYSDLGFRLALAPTL
jgi:formylglycine-generating enzyme required for sulfatase activity